MQTTTHLNNHSQFLAGTAEDEHMRDDWGRTCETLRHHLSSYANRLTNHMTQDAEDLVHDTYCRAFAHLRNLSSINNPQAYLFRMMRNVWIDRWKKEHKANFESLEELKTKEMVSRRFIVAPTVLQALEHEDLKQSIYRRGRLTPREHQLLEMLFDGKSCAEIADAFNEDVRLVRVNINALRNKIRYRTKSCSKKSV